MKNYRFIPPKNTYFQKIMASWINSAKWQDARYRLFSRLPYLKMKSDAADIVYMNWVVPTELIKLNLSHFIPKGMTLIERDGLTILTILTYQHKHFGPKIAGPFRRLFPSPQQSNWRFYLDYSNQKHQKRTVIFIKNLMNSALYTYITRLFTDVLPTHLPNQFSHLVTDKYIATEIKAGAGSASEMSFLGIIEQNYNLPSEFHSFFNTWEDAMKYICLQNSAISVGHSVSFIAEAEIKLPIRIEEIISVKAVDYIPGELLVKLGANALPFCFLVKNVEFEVLSEKRIDVS
ncbi:DUF2071 domain-containing protein [Thorsellia anophelis]|uniref:Uncharacterized conserved protein (COG2071) n=1 Tax=Thorsellia anophelis DSM 18579 TaxID=1123402 RepID=A0A1I0BH69_9GAMM|nr:DUF2071 domain-containing protein [Thorsellia anophelis]SET06317.1 Uncharacterized conserved protein (COG2071) [Thorsellia anophelis DSM 18579]